MLQTIHLAGLPLSWQERAAADAAAFAAKLRAFTASSDDPAAPAWDVQAGSLPLVFAGGPTATSNPEPYADFCDYFALGDGEECLPEIGACLQEAIAARLSRHGTLLRLARSVRGVYVPSLYDAAPGWGGAVFPLHEGVPARVQRRVAAPDPSQQIGLVPYVSTVHDRLTVEIRRGCTRGCRFCQPGMLTRPARDVEPDAVIAAVKEGVRKTGYTDFSLLCAPRLHACQLWRRRALTAHACRASCITQVFVMQRLPCASRSGAGAAQPAGGPGARRWYRAACMTQALTRAVLRVTRDNRRTSR